MDEIATGSFKLDVCRGPKQVHFKAWSEDLKKVRLYQKSNHCNLRKKYIKFYVDLQQTADMRFFPLKSKLSGLS